MNCAEIARDRLGQHAYESFSIKRSFRLFKFRLLRSRNSPYGGVKLEYRLQNTRIRPLKRQHPRETVAPSGVCKYIVPNVSQYWNSCTGYGARRHPPSSLNETSLWTWISFAPGLIMSLFHDVTPLRTYRHTENRKKIWCAHNASHFPHSLGGVDKSTVCVFAWIMAARLLCSGWSEKFKSWRLSLHHSVSISSTIVYCKVCVSCTVFLHAALLIGKCEVSHYLISYVIFYARKQLLLSARLSHRNSVRPSVRPSVCLSHGWISEKQCKLASPNLHRRLPGRL